jgi:hypothetical protein
MIHLPARYMDIGKPHSVRESTPNFSTMNEIPLLVMALPKQLLRIVVMRVKKIKVFFVCGNVSSYETLNFERGYSHTRPVTRIFRVIFNPGWDWLLASSARIRYHHGGIKVLLFSSAKMHLRCANVLPKVVVGGCR